MAMYTVGGKVRLRSDLELGGLYGGVPFGGKGLIGKVVTIKSVDDDGDYQIEEDNQEHYYSDKMFEGLADPREVNEPRTFKQLTENIFVKKDALWRTGSQGYELLNDHFSKDPGEFRRIFDRSLVENDPENFVEVFKVQPEYVTREELDRWEAFKSEETPQVTTSPSPKHVPKHGVEVSDNRLQETIGAVTHSRSRAAALRKLKISSSTLSTYMWEAKRRGLI